jgi:hypothetical protein
VKTNLFCIMLMSFLAFSSTHAKSTPAQPLPKPPSAKVLTVQHLPAAKVTIPKPKVHKKLQVKLHHIATIPRRDHEEQRAITPVPPPTDEKCSILKTADPEDNIAFTLWAAFVASPRHATRAAWEKFEHQPEFFRMAAATMAICGQPMNAIK